MLLKSSDCIDSPLSMLLANSCTHSRSKCCAYHQSLYNSPLIKL